MAITVYDSPDVVSSVNSDIIFDVTTDSTDITTKIIAIVFYRRKQSDFYRVASKKSQGKKTGYNYFRFNLKGVLRTILEADYQEGSTGIYTNITNSSIEYFVKFTEYYPIPNPTAHASTNSSSFYAVNTNILNTETQGVYTGSDWYMDGVASHKFLTNSPSSLPIRASERIQLGFLTSYTDPIVKLTEIKNNGSSATTTYSIGNQTYNHYLWDWTVDSLEEVAIETEDLYTETTYVEALSATSDYKYMPDNVNKMWGGVKLVADNDVIDVVLPVITAASADVVINTIAKTSNADFELYFYYSSAWNISAGSPYTATTAGFANTTETLVAGTTKLRIKKLNSAGTQELWIPYAYITYLDNNAQNKRCQFTMDTTHVDSDTHSFQVLVENGSSGVISETKTFVVDRSLIGDSSRFAFRNLRGDFDHYTFKQGHEEALAVEKIMVENELPVGFSKADTQSKVAFINSDIVFTSWTEYEENETLSWLKELVESREVYLISGDVRYAVNILTSEIKYSHHTEPLQFEIQWSFSSKRNI